MKNRPDYKKIYYDLITTRFPEKKIICAHLLSKEELTVIDIIEFSRILSDKNVKEVFQFNQRHRSYNESTILQILQYQKDNRLSNLQLSRHFGMSRNTIAKWKNQFLS